MNLASPWSVLVNSLNYVPKYEADVRACKMETYDMILQALRSGTMTAKQVQMETALSKAHTQLCLYELQDLGKVRSEPFGRGRLWSLK